jgi:hypothetical protein
MTTAVLVVHSRPIKFLGQPPTPPALNLFRELKSVCPANLSVRTSGFLSVRCPGNRIADL